MKERDLLRRLETVKSHIEAVSSSPIVYDLWVLTWLERTQRQLVALYEARGEYGPRRGRL